MQAPASPLRHTHSKALAETTAACVNHTDHVTNMVQQEALTTDGYLQELNTCTQATTHYLDMLADR
jgi:hypothetical protein